MIKSDKILKMLNELKIEELKQMLIDDIKQENSGLSANLTKNQKKLYDYIQKNYGKREIFKNCNIVDDIQYITNSLIAFKLKNHNIFFENDKTGIFPKMDFLFNCLSFDYNMNYKTSDILNSIKIAKTLKTKLVIEYYDINGNLKYNVFDYKLLEIVLSGLNYNSDYIQLRFNGLNKPIYVINGVDVACFMPVNSNNIDITNFVNLENGEIYKNEVEENE